ncbi:MAG: ATP-binding protein [Oligoflexales bacterium]
MFQLKNSIGKKLLFYIVLSSSSITLIFTIISFTIDYKNETEQMNQVFSFIERTNLDSISNAVYLLHNSQIKTQGEGIFKHQDIIATEINDEDGETLFSDLKSTTSNQESDYIFVVDWIPFLEGHIEKRDFPLVHADETDPIGILKVTLSKDNMYKRLSEKLIVFFSTQLVKTFIVSLIILILFNLLITQHLAKMANFLSAYADKAAKKPKNIILNRKIPKIKDEIEILKLAINEMYSESWKTKKAILENIRQGIIIIEEDLKIGSEYSPHVTILLGLDNVAGEDIKVILQKMDLDLHKTEQIRSTIECAIGFDDKLFLLNQHHLPTRVKFSKFNESQESIVLEVFWDIISDKEGIVEKIIMCFRDITYITAVEEKFEQSQLETKILHNIVNARVRNFEGFMQHWEWVYHECLECIERKDMNQLLSNLHTFKGTSSIVGFSEISMMVHYAEDYFYNNKPFINHEPSSDHLVKINSMVQAYDEVYKKYLADNLNNFSEDFVAVSSTNISNIYSDKKIKEVEKVSQFLEIYTKADLQINRILSPIREQLPNLSKRLSKPTPKVKAEGEDIFVKSSLKQVLTDILGHLVRNSLDHGLETVEERKKKGKKEVGTISMKFEVNKDKLLIAYEDDGCGVDLAKIQERCKDTNFKDENEIIDKLFDPGFSTRQEVTEVSGRGMGLYAVKKTFQQYGGDIKACLKSQSSATGQNFCFEMEIPLSIAENVSQLRQANQSV